MMETGTQQCGPKHKGCHFDQVTAYHLYKGHATAIKTSLCVVQTSSEVRKLEILTNSLRMRRRKRQRGLLGCVGW